MIRITLEFEFRFLERRLFSLNAQEGDGEFPVNAGSVRRNFGDPEQATYGVFRVVLFQIALTEHIPDHRVAGINAY